MKLKLTKFNSYSCRKWSTIGGLFVILWPLGLQWYWGNMSIYAESYIVKYVDSDTARVQAPWVMSFLEVGSCIGLFASGLLCKTFGNKLTMIFGIVLYAVGMVGAHFTVKMSAMAMNVIIGLVCATGRYIANGVSMSIAVEFAKDDFGFLNAMIQSVFPAGAIAINQIATYYTNPDNLLPDALVCQSYFFSQTSVVDNVPGLFLVLAAIVISSGIVGLFMISKNTNDDDDDGAKEKLTADTECVTRYGGTNLEDGVTDLNGDPRGIDVMADDVSPTGNGDGKNIKVARDNSVESSSGVTTSFVSYDDEREMGREDLLEDFNGYQDLQLDGESENDVTSSSDGQTDLSPRQVIRCRSLYCYWSFAILGEITYILVTNYYKAFGQIFIRDDHFLTNVSVALLLAIAVSRLGWGKVLDRFGLKKTYILYFSSCAVASMGFFYSVRVNRFMYAMATLFFGGVGNPMYLLISYCCIKSYGRTYFLMNYALIFLPTFVTSVALPLVIQYIIDNRGWGPLYFYCSCGNVLGLIIAIVCLPKK